MGADNAADASRDSTYTDRPWYLRTPDATFFNATAEHYSALIQGYDSPSLWLPVLFNQASWNIVNRAAGLANVDPDYPAL